MSILNVNKINPVGGGSTITISGITSITNSVSVANSVTASSFHGDLTGNLTGGLNISGGGIKAQAIATGINVTGRIGVGSDIPLGSLDILGSNSIPAINAFGRNYYLQNESNAFASLTLKKATTASDTIDYIQFRDSSNNLKYNVTGIGSVTAANLSGIQIKGSSPANPAATAQEIKDAHTSTPDNDWYYIKQYGNTARLHYCVFKDYDGNDIAGGPWVVNWITGVPDTYFSSTGSTAMTQYVNLCKQIGIDKPGRGMESTRTTAEVYGAWLATKRAIWETDPHMFDGASASSGAGGVLIMPIMNINGQGGSSDHRTVYSSGNNTHIPPNENGDHCNANQLFCGWWGTNDYTSWATNNNAVPSPEDWDPGNGTHTAAIGAKSSSTSFKPSFRDKMLVTCIFR